MSSQTQSGVGVDEETWESLRDTIASFFREEMEKLRDEMRKGSMATRIEFPRFGGDDVKGWLSKSEHYFQVNNIPDESKVNFIATHLFGVALLWHEQILKIMGKDMVWVIYKDMILQRFSNVATPKFSCNSVMNSSSLNLNDDLDEFVVFYQVKDKKNNSALEVFDEMSIKKIIKQDTSEECSDIKEAIKVGSGLVEEVVVATVKEPFEVENTLVVDHDGVKYRSTTSLSTKGNPFVVDGKVGSTDNKVFVKHHEDLVVVLDEVCKDVVEVEGNQSRDAKENGDDKKCLLISNYIVKKGNGSKDDNGWFENQIAEPSNKLKMDSEYVMRRNKELLGVAWKPMVKMRLKSLESTKGGLEMLNRNGVNNLEGLVGFGNFRKNAVGLLKVKDALLLGLHGCLNCSDRFSIGHGYVYKTNTSGELIFAATLVFDPGGKGVCDLGVSHGRNVFGKHVLPGDISKQEMGGNVLVSNDTIVGSADKLTDKWFKISTITETKVGYLRIRLWCVSEDIDSFGGRMRSHVIVKSDVLFGEMNPSGMKSVANILEVTKFAILKKFVREEFEKLLGTKLVLNTQIKSIAEPMSVNDWSEEVFKKVVKSFECCYSECRFVLDIASDWKFYRWLEGSHTLASASAMESSFKVNGIHESSAANKWYLGQLEKSSNAVKYTMVNFLQVSKEEWKKQGSKQIVSAAQLTEREACVKVLLLEVASVYKYDVRCEIRQGIEDNKWVLWEVPDQCTPTQNMWLMFWGYRLRNGYSVTKFCVEDGGLSFVDRVHLLSFVGGLNLKTSPEPKLSTLKLLYSVKFSQKLKSSLNLKFSLVLEPVVQLMIIKGSEQQEVIEEASISCGNEDMQSYILHGVGYHNHELSNTLTLGINLLEMGIYKVIAYVAIRNEVGKVQGIHVPTQKMIQGLDTLSNRLEELLQNAMNYLGKRMMEQFEGVFTHEFHHGIYQIRATHVPRASASAVTFGIGVFGGKRGIGAGKHRVFTVSRSYMTLRSCACDGNCKSYRKHQVTLAHNLTERNEITGSLGAHYGLHFTDEVELLECIRIACGQAIFEEGSIVMSLYWSTEVKALKSKKVNNQASTKVKESQ